VRAANDVTAGSDATAGNSTDRPMLVPASIPRRPNRSTRGLAHRLVACVALVGLAAACSPRQEASGRGDILLLTLDTTRRDRIGAYGDPRARTPNLDRIARRGVLFEEAASACPLTLPSHATILTGLYPPSHGVRNNGIDRLPDEAVTLAEILRDEGYECAAVVASYVLHHRFGIDQGFPLYDDLIDAPAGRIAGDPPSRPAGPVTDSALRTVDDLDSKRRAFLWVHYFDPHTPLEPPEPFRDWLEGRPYEAEIANMDHEVGRLLEGLDARGRLEESWIVAVGDHGEGLGEPHAEQGHGMFLYDETVLVPLAVSGPRSLRGAIVDAPVRTVDLFPTILALSGLPGGGEGPGTSLAETVIRLARPVPRPGFAETMAPWDEFGWSPLYSVRNGRWKWIEAPAPELYDLNLDPGESVNRADREPGVAAALREELRKVLRGASRRPSSAPSPLGAEDLDRLARLGYLASGERTLPPDRPLRDPKSTILLRPRLDRAYALARSGDVDAAAPLFEEILAEDPQNFLALRELGRVRLEQGRPELAEPLLERLARLDGGSLETRVALARSRLEQALRLVDADRLDEARDEVAPSEPDLRAACAEAPGVEELFVRHAEILVILGREKEAAERLEQGCRLHPDSTVLPTYLARVLVLVGRDDDARRVLAELLARDPDLPEARDLAESLAPR
jgi:arylsulfatase A-like enzyme/cytochrome c-type biogenesis protein CcmH/NrfG